MLVIGNVEASCLENFNHTARSDFRPFWLYPEIFAGKNFAVSAILLQLIEKSKMAAPTRLNSGTMMKSGAERWFKCYAGENRIASTSNKYL